MKKFVLLFISCLIIGFALSWQVSKNQANTQQVKFEELFAFKEKPKSIEPPLILEEDFIQPEKVKEQIKIKEKKVVKKDLEAITAEAYFVGNFETGQIYLEFNSTKVFPIASLSKLFTSIVATHLIDKEKQITITQQMLDTIGDAGHLVKDEKFTALELLYPLLLESSNDAAEALAQSSGYEKFIKAMNSLALEMSMSKTSFKDASGLNPANVSNAKDLFSLAKYIYKNEKAILDITDQKEMTLATTTEHGSYKFVTINPFVDYPPFIGGKTGRTQEARESMISLFNVAGTASTTYPIAVILLRSDLGEREMDTERILEKAQKVFGK